MFSASKIAKPKAFTAPSHKESSKSNSRKKFTCAMNKGSEELCNRSFDTAQSLLNSAPNLRQSRLCLRKQQSSDENEPYDMPGPSKRSTATLGFSLMPAPENKSVHLKRPFEECSSENGQKNSENKTAPLSERTVAPSNPMSINGRNKRLVMGKVDFCLKMHKLYPDWNILWDIYGKIVKIIPGNNRGENILILRAVNDRGPVIQSIYYDFNNVLANFSPGTCLRAIGEFMNENRLRTFKLEHFDCEKHDKEFSRIQNVTAFALLQCKVEASQTC